jgi:hypothetical protein
LKYRVSGLWPRYIGEVRTNFAIAYGIKVGCYWELFGKHVKNLGTLCFDTPPKKKKKLAWKVHCLLSKWKVNNGPFTLHTKHNLKIKTLLPSPTRKEGRPLHFTM